jgi:hypothetical protein
MPPRDIILKHYQELPPEKQAVIDEMIESLFSGEKVEKVKLPTFTWQGALRSVEGEKTSVQLQHEISAYRANR